MSNDLLHKALICTKFVEQMSISFIIFLLYNPAAYFAVAADRS